MPILTTSDQRIQSHNAWPKKVEFSAEAEFQKKIATAGGLAPFATAKLADAGTPEFHRFLGSLIDGLDALPQRPDYLFDHCFRIIDAGAKMLTAKTRTTYAISEVYLNIFSTDHARWATVVNMLAASMPKSSSDYIARRLLDASIGKGSDPVAIVTRARKCLGNQRFAEITQKYSYAAAGAAPGSAVNECGSFLRLLLKTETPAKSAPKPGGLLKYPTLDLSAQGNLLKPEEKLRLILSLFLFTMRNERQHGSAVSPFRTSKAKLERYASFYYAMIFAYSVALGIISALDSKSIGAATILQNADANLAEFKKFFGANAK